MYVLANAKDILVNFQQDASKFVVQVENELTISRFW